MLHSARPKITVRQPRVKAVASRFQSTTTAGPSAGTPPTGTRRSGG